MNERNLQKSVNALRLFIQWGFFSWMILLVVRFAMFVRHFESGGSAPFVSRPPGVEGFLPIGALVSLKHWLVSGEIHPVHPAALAIFLSAILMSLLARKSFCSWLCPVGTISEAAGKLGKRLLGKNLLIWRPLDIVLRGLKYLLLLFFVKLILIDMTAQTAAGFLDAPYWAVGDVKMLYFFSRMSVTTMVILAILTGLSFLYVNFWCRYLCPYGALLGLAGMLSPWKIRRDSEGCTSCGQCTSGCPASLPVHSKMVVRSPECSGCLTCTSACPEKGVLRMALPLRQRSLPVWVFPAILIFIFFAGIGAGMATGHWQTSLSYADYQRIIPMVSYLGH